MSTIRLSARSRLKLARWTFFGTTGCVVVSVAFNLVAFRDLGEEALAQAIISAVVLPVILATPLFFLLTLKLRELAIANHRLNLLATTDGLTGCLTRGAFTTALAKMMDDDPAGAGTLLLIDADHFKQINDRFGHDCGDDALRLITTAIRSTLRGGDMLGRLGGEEFGVYLAGVAPDRANRIAERIRGVVASAAFMPDGERRPLSVSIGGVILSEATTFPDLFRIADKRLYDAKAKGRNRVVMAGFVPVSNGPLPFTLH